MLLKRPGLGVKPLERRHTPDAVGVFAFLEIVMIRNGLFSSESVSEGHPDKSADRISDAISG